MSKIPVFYTYKQVVTRKFGMSPSAMKPALVVESWQEKGFPIEIHEPQPALVEDLCRAHSSEFVEGILRGRIPNGFGNFSPTVIASLPWTSGSMLSAARFVLSQGLKVAVSPTSGFHHAGWTSADGFCTFNGLMVTAMNLMANGLAENIGILDLDEHYGNGTDHIIRKLGLTNIRHYTYGSVDSRHIDGNLWLDTLPAVVQSFHACDIVLFQAGADCHEHDPSGRGLLSTEQMLKRDRIVFRNLWDIGVPVVWNLAGGYQEPLRRVLDLHDNTMMACVETYSD